jgi:hypothetical protein
MRAIADQTDIGWVCSRILDGAPHGFWGLSSRILKGVPHAYCMVPLMDFGRIVHHEFPRCAGAGNVGFGHDGRRPWNRGISITAGQFVRDSLAQTRTLLSWFTSTSSTYRSTYQGLHQVVERVCKTVGLSRTEQGSGSLQTTGCSHLGSSFTTRQPAFGWSNCNGLWFSAPLRMGLAAIMHRE